MDSAGPLTPECSRNIGHGVLANAVDARAPNPPQRILDQIARHLRVGLVEIGKDVGEPAVQRATAQLRRGVRIENRPGLPGVRQVILFRAVEPVRHRRVGHPRMIRPGVVGYLILNHLESQAMRVLNQGAILRQHSQMLVDAVEIDGSVAVVIGNGLVVVFLALVQVVRVVVDRREPDGGDAEVFQIGKLLPNPREIAAVIIAGLAAVVQAARNGWIVVRRIAVGKPVRHDQVNHVVGREAVLAVCERLRNRERSRSRAVRRGDPQCT